MGYDTIVCAKFPQTRRLVQMTCTPKFFPFSTGWRLETKKQKQKDYVQPASMLKWVSGNCYPHPHLGSGAGRVLQAAWQRLHDVTTDVHGHSRTGRIQQHGPNRWTKGFPQTLYCKNHTLLGIKIICYWAWNTSSVQVERFFFKA